jgi:sec-independent protein translocase protein TatB
MLNIGPPELILIFVIALVIVGPQRLPELGRTIGKGLREFRKMQDEVKDLVNTGMGDEFKETAAELKRTASDLKSATDVRSAFRNDAPRSRPHGTRRSLPGRTVTPEPDRPGPDEDVTAPPPAASGAEAPTGEETPREPDAPSASPVEADEPGPDA